MDADRRKRALAVFTESLELPEEAIPEFIHRACDGDDALRDEVNRLWAASQQVEAEGFLARQPDLSVKTFLPDQSPDPLINTCIGPYLLQRRLGEGGMGVVYLAEQTAPIHREIALKIIKLGMDTQQVIARFEAEREALALMNHPNVARVIDAGSTDQGRPYFVMEYVDGEPITAYCDKHRLTIAERLLLFFDVCNAIQHAHQKGIIHRDIKPSNVLVAAPDAKSVPKVIDFGVAKATQQRLTERTMFTEQGQLIGTPGYMSPEQASLTAPDIDTRTDVYSLGVLLYELLAGALPFDPESMLHAAFEEIQRIIREVDPPKPSTRLNGLGEVSTAVAEKRRTEVRTLARQLRGDLDWIVMKCLEKDRTRRYDTVNGLVLDIQRYLNNETVFAGPPSAAYRFRKFARRNKGSLVAASTVVLSLAGGVVVSSRLYLTAEAARRGERVAREDAEKERDTATEARDEAEQVVEFLSETLSAADPKKEGKEVTVREMMEKAADRVGDKFSSKPIVEARLRRAIGWTYHGLGLPDAAQTHLAEAAAIYDRELGPRDPRTLGAASVLAVVIGAKGHFSQAEAAQRSTLEIQRRVLGEQHPQTLNSIGNLGASIVRQGRYAEAEELFRKVLEIRRRVQGEEHPDTLTSSNNLAGSLLLQGRHVDAETLYRRTLEIQCRALGEEHPETLESMNNLASSLIFQGRYGEAETFYRKAFDVRRRVLGEEHPQTLTSMTSLANSLSDQGSYAEAETLSRHALEIQRRVLTAEHQDTLRSLSTLAKILCLQGHYAEAETLLRQRLENSRRVLGAEHPDTLTSMNSLAISLYALGRYAEAETLQLQTLENSRRILGAEHPGTLRSMNNLANSVNAQGRYVEAEALYQQTLETRRRVLGEQHPDTLLSMSNLASSLDDQGRYDEAELLFRRTLEDQRRILGDGHPDVAETLDGLAVVMEKTQRCAEAEHLCRQAGSIWAARLPAEHRSRRTNVNLLGGILAGLGRFAEAEPLLIESYDELQNEFGQPTADKKAMVDRFVRLYESWDAAEPGKGHAEMAAKYRALLPLDPPQSAASDTPAPR